MKGIVAALLVLVGFGLGLGVGLSIGETIESADADGKAVFENLPAGDYVAQTTEHQPKDFSVPPTTEVRFD